MRNTQLGLFIDETLTFDYVEGAVSEVMSPYTTGWRALPYAVVCQWKNTRIRLDLQGGRATMLDGGDVLIIPAKVRHCVTTLSQEMALCRWAHLEYSALGSISLLSMLKSPVSIPDGDGCRIGDYLERLALLRGGSTFDLALAAQRKTLGFALLALLCELTALQKLGAMYFHQTARLQPVLRYVYESYDQEVTRDSMAEKIGLSPTHLHSLFKKSLGVAPMDYVRSLRLQRAQALLVETELTVAEVGERVGISDPFYFSRQFKRLSGVSPTKYREETRRAMFPGISD